MFANGSMSGFFLGLLLAIASSHGGCAGPQALLDPDEFESDITFERTEVNPPLSLRSQFRRAGGEGQGQGAHNSRFVGPQAHQDLIDEVSAFADQVNRAVQHEAIKPAPRTVQWIDAPRVRLRRRPPRPRAADPNQPAATAAAQPEPRQQKPHDPKSDSSTVESSGNTNSLHTDRRTVLNLLRRSIRQGDDDPALKALWLATLSMLENEPLPSEELAHLDPNQRRHIDQYQTILLALRNEITSGEGQLDHATLIEHVEQVFADVPIHIKTVKLVRRVHSFGVYEAFRKYQFLAAREQPLIVYVELESFQIAQTKEDRFQVHLSQEIELYTSPGGVQVWHQPREEVTDESRNRRRDFFIRQLIRLPKNIGVGEYVLKVRVTDINGGSIDERSVPLVVVADERLLGQSVDSDQ